METLEDTSSVGDRPDFQFTFAYWNDNFDYEKSLSDFMKIGKDDYVTASFWLQVASEWNSIHWLLDSYLSVLTDREAGYRTDLLTIRLSQVKPFSFGKLQYGVGIVLSGNFGGSAIQNSYHKIRNIEEIDLNYDDEGLTGITGFLRWEKELYRFNRFNISNHVANSLRHRAGPSNINAGLAANYVGGSIWLISSYHMQTYLGYTYYNRVRKQLSNIFGSGIVVGGLISVVVKSKSSVALWFTHNQYGRGQPHFGITIGFGLNDSRIFDLKDIFIP